MGIGRGYGGRGEGTYHTQGRAECHTHHTVLYTMYCTLCIVHYVLYSVGNTLCIVQCREYSMYCTV